MLEESLHESYCSLTTCTRILHGRCYSLYMRLNISMLADHAQSKLWQILITLHEKLLQISSVVTGTMILYHFHLPMMTPTIRSPGPGSAQMVSYQYRR